MAGVHSPSLEASSSARCIAGTSARSASWWRQDSPSASTHGALVARAPPAAGGSRRPRPTRRSGRAPSRSCRPARSSPAPGPPSAPAGPQQPRVGLPAEDRRVVAVRLRDHAYAGQVGRLPAALRSAARRAWSRRAASSTARRVVGQLDDVAAQHRQAGRLQPDDRHAALDVRRERRDGPARRSGAAASSWPVVIQVSPQQAVVRDHRGGSPASAEHPDRGLGVLRQELVGERVGPDPHVRASRPVVRFETLPQASSSRTPAATAAGPRRPPPSRPGPAVRSPAGSAAPATGAASAAHRGSRPSV